MITTSIFILKYLVNSPSLFPEIKYVNKQAGDGGSSPSPFHIVYGGEIVPDLASAWEGLDTATQANPRPLLAVSFSICLSYYFCRFLISYAQKVDRSNMDKYKKETPMMARNRSLYKRLMAFAPPHHYPAYVATMVERDENGAYLKIPLISPLTAAYKHQACKYCNSFEVGTTLPSSYLPLLTSGF